MDNKALAAILSAEIIVQESNVAIEHLSIDSRKVLHGSNTLFFAIKSEKNNGHKYLQELYEKGVRNFVVSENINASGLSGSTIYKTANTVNALQALVAAHRSQFSLPCVGITGSNGKTIVKEWLWQLLNPDFNVVRSPKSYNSQVGVPLSVWALNAKHQLALFEAGISEPGEMENLERVIQPNIGIFTNIGQAHEKNFKSERDKIREKLKLFKNCTTVILPADDEKILSEWLKTGYTANIIGWSFRKKGNLNLRKTAANTLLCQWKGQEFEVKIPFNDEASIENAATCLLAALHLGLSAAQLTERLALITPVGMRLEMLEGVNNTLLINDAYSADLSSLAIALDFLDQQNQHPKKSLIISDILEAGLSDELLYKRVAKIAVDKKIDRIIGIGKAISQYANVFPNNSEFFESTQAFLEQFNTANFQQEGILIKGARIFAFERITNALQKKAHETVLEINLNAIVHNLSYFKSQLEGTKIMAMVKAAAYGSGNTEIAKLMEYHRVDYLGVAYINEGIDLRKAGINLPIMVMNPDQQHFDTLLQHQLEPEVFNWSGLRAIVAAAKKMDTSKKPYPIHLKIDTGMHRLGFAPGQVDELIALLKAQDSVKLATVMSHLSSADEPQWDDFTRQQISTFEQLVTKLKAVLPYNFTSHLANTAGAARFPEAKFDMVRLGIGLYGIATVGETQRKLQVAARLKTHISQISTVLPGDSVGYNRKFMLTKAHNIATIPIGYADGLPRKLGNERFSLLVNGLPANIVGNVCMDMCMLNVSDIDCQEGDEVIVFGPEKSIEEMALALETIPYEVLTGISQRVKRVFYQE